MGLAYCFCSASGSLCNACLGTTIAGTTGRKRSVLLLCLTIAFALFFQYKVAPSIVLNTGWIWKTYRAVPGMGKTVYHAWKDPYCTGYDSEALVVQCAGIGGVYRPTALATLFFIISAIATKLVPALNREAWLAKYTVFLFGVFFTMFIPNAPIFIGLFLWLARFGAAIFVVLQQVILIDLAYNWNEDWVEKSNECDRLSYGSGQKWLRAIVATCVGMYSLAIIGISLLYRFFDGCPENTTVITLTLLSILAMTAIQLSGYEGSLLTSSVMSVYATYLCFSIVSKNPNAMCNPRLGHSDAWGIVIGMSLTFLSLAWTGWSWSAEQRLTIER
jgi:serine incorporator 1/3